MSNKEAVQSKAIQKKLEREPEQYFPTIKIHRKLARPWLLLLNATTLFNAGARQTTTEPSVSLRQTLASCTAPRIILRKEVGLLGYHAEDLNRKNNICNTVRKHPRHCECPLLQLLGAILPHLASKHWSLVECSSETGTAAPEHCRTSKTFTRSCAPSCTSHWDGTVAVCS